MEMVPFPHSSRSWKSHIHPPSSDNWAQRWMGPAEGKKKKKKNHFFGREEATSITVSFDTATHYTTCRDYPIRQQDEALIHFLRITCLPKDTHIHTGGDCTHKVMCKYIQYLQAYCVQRRWNLALKQTEIYASSIIYHKMQTSSDINPVLYFTYSLQPWIWTLDHAW